MRDGSTCVCLNQAERKNPASASPHKDPTVQPDVAVEAGAAQVCASGDFLHFARQAFRLLTALRRWFGGVLVRVRCAASSGSESAAERPRCRKMH